jgi:hypothetical protein
MPLVKYAEGRHATMELRGVGTTRTVRELNAGIGRWPGIRHMSLRSSAEGELSDRLGNIRWAVETPRA